MSVANPIFAHQGESGWSHHNNLEVGNQMLVAGVPLAMLSGVLYVYSGATGDGDGLSWGNAATTIDAAVNLCVGGEVILVHPLHEENLGADSAIDVDVAGVMIFGMQLGNRRPRLTATAVAGDLKLAAAGCSIWNLEFIGGIDNTTGCIEVGAADCGIYNCIYRDSTGEAVDVIIALAGADRLKIKGWTHIGITGGDANTSIAVVDCDDVEIVDFYIYGSFALGAIQFRTTLSLRTWIHGPGMIWTEHANDIGIKDLVTGTTGTIGPDLNFKLKDNAANIATAIVGATFQVFDPIYVVNLVNEKGMLTTRTASTDA